MEKIIKKYSLAQALLQDDSDWINKSDEERISAVEMFRKQYYGTLPRLQRTVNIIHWKKN